MCVGRGGLGHVYFRSLKMKKRIRRCDPEKQRRWEEVLRQWREGGQSVRAFCRAAGLREAAFYWWRRELARRGDRNAAGDGLRARTATPVSRPVTRVSPRRAPAPAFLPVRVVDPDATATVGSVEILLAEGRAVRVLPGFDRQTLADVLAVLEVRPC
jgi:transposase-like protein